MKIKPVCVGRSAGVDFQIFRNEKPGAVDILGPPRGPVPVAPTAL